MKDSKEKVTPAYDMLLLVILLGLAVECDLQPYYLLSHSLFF